MLCFETGKDTWGCGRWRRNSRLREGTATWTRNEMGTYFPRGHKFGAGETNEGVNMTNKFLASEFREKQEPPGRQSLKTPTSDLKYNQ